MEINTIISPWKAPNYLIDNQKVWLFVWIDENLFEDYEKSNKDNSIQYSYEVWEKRSKLKIYYFSLRKNLWLKWKCFIFKYNFWKF